MRRPRSKIFKSKRNPKKYRQAIEQTTRRGWPGRLANQENKIKTLPRTLKSNSTQIKNFIFFKIKVLEENGGKYWSKEDIFKQHTQEITKSPGSVRWSVVPCARG